MKKLLIVLLVMSWSASSFGTERVQQLLPNGDQIFFDSFEACVEFFEAYPDMDGDLWGAIVDPVLFCNQYPHNYTLTTGDCDDTSSLIFPGNPEVCDGLDNDCSGAVDDGLPVDSFESNDSCNLYSLLSQVGSNQTINYNRVTVYPQGDEDYYLIPANETDNTCQNCDGFFLDEDYQLEISLSVPLGAGSFLFCTGTLCDSVNDNCMEINAGQQNSWVWTFDGSCVEDDAYSVYVRVYGGNSPASDCAPYTLSYNFKPGCF